MIADLHNDAVPKHIQENAAVLENIDIAAVRRFVAVVCANRQTLLDLASCPD